MTKTIIVTGAAGFIGSHVAQSILERGDRVIGVDNLDPYYDPANKRRNLAEVQAAAGDADQFAFVEGDVRDRRLAEELCSRQQVDAIAHLAALAGVRASVAEPAVYYDVNLTGTLRWLDSARDNGVGNIVFASTSSVYGATDKTPFVETDPCDRPLAPYPASKRAAELLGYTYHHLYGLNFIGLRFFTVYGPRGRPDMMAYQLADSIISGREVLLYNEGKLYRDWTFVSDIVAGVVAALDRPMGYELINIGRGEPVLLSDFVRSFEELSGRKANLKSAEMPAADVPYTFADIDKARRLLDYVPRVSVTEGVRRFWDWYQEVSS